MANRAVFFKIGCNTCLVKEYLKVLREDQTLFIASGHPIGLFDSHKDAPRVSYLTNGLMVGMFDKPDIFANVAAMGVANYGQMTAGGWMYIGPKASYMEHTVLYLMPDDLKLGLDKEDDLRGKLFVSSGLGGMSGAQGKAIVIAKGCRYPCGSRSLTHQDPSQSRLGR
jgi:urocanate hydratase